jgi:pimeloyl-ACP methyl ester carboxylesterase
MSLFCLIHGSTQNTAGWDLLAPELARLGHESMRVALPTDCPDASGTVYADAIARSLNGDDAIVVAHSASGAFLPLVPSRHKIGRMVFLGSIVPRPGTSILGQVQADPTVLNPAWIGKDPTKDEKLAREFLFHDCSEEVYRWALTTRALMLARQAMIEICRSRNGRTCRLLTSCAVRIEPFNRSGSARSHASFCRLSLSRSTQAIARTFLVQWS